MYANDPDDPPVRVLPRPADPRDNILRKAKKTNDKWYRLDKQRRRNRRRRMRRSAEAARKLEAEKAEEAKKVLELKDEDMTPAQEMQVGMMSIQQPPGRIQTIDDYTGYSDLERLPSTLEAVMEEHHNNTVHPDKVIPLDTLSFLDTDPSEMKINAGRLQDALKTISSCSKTLQVRVSGSQVETGSNALRECGERYFEWWFNSWLSQSSYTAKGVSPADIIYSAWCHTYLCYHEGPIVKVTSDVIKAAWRALDNIRLSFLTNMKEASEAFDAMKHTLAACVCFFMSGKDANFRVKPRGIDGTIEISRKHFMGTLCSLHWFVEYAARFFHQHEIVKSPMKVYKGVRDLVHEYLEKEPDPALVTAINDVCWANNSLLFGKIYQHDGSGTAESASAASDFMTTNGKKAAKLSGRFFDADYDEVVRDAKIFSKILEMPEYKDEVNLEWKLNGKTKRGAPWVRQCKGKHPAYPVWVLSTIASIYRTLDQSVDWLDDYVVWGYELGHKARWLNQRVANGELRLPIIIMIHPTLFFVQQIPRKARATHQEEDAIEDSGDEKSTEQILREHYQRPLANPRAKKRLWKCGCPYEAALVWSYLVKTEHKSTNVDGVCFGRVIRQFFGVNKP